MTAGVELPAIDLLKEQRLVKRRGIAAAVCCVLFLMIGVIAFPSWFDYPSLLPERLAFALRWNLLVVLWVIIGVRIVAKIRFKSVQDNRGSAYGKPSERLAVPAAFLQNTVEQAVMAFPSYLALATVPGNEPLGYIVVGVILFCLGRISFFLGYRHGAGGRAFGMVMTMLPTLGAWVWVCFIW